ncbi:hypothetical protein DAEQUDRAFT_730258, partial [Daedalea quercina L-15889]
IWLRLSAVSPKLAYYCNMCGSAVELRLFRVLHDGIGLILTCYGLVFYVATYYIHSLRT